MIFDPSKYTGEKQGKSIWQQQKELLPIRSNLSIS